MFKILSVFVAVAATAKGQFGLFGGGQQCSLIKPSDPQCCFMLDPEHEKSQGNSQDIARSPYLINLIGIKDKSFNKFERTASPNLLKLSPLKDDPNDPAKQIKGGAVKMQVGDAC